MMVGSCQKKNDSWLLGLGPDQTPVGYLDWDLIKHPEHQVAYEINQRQSQAYAGIGQPADRAKPPQHTQPSTC
jgi:hypothetical protein